MNSFYILEKSKSMSETLPSEGNQPSAAVEQNTTNRTRSLIDRSYFRKLHFFLRIGLIVSGVNKT